MTAVQLCFPDSRLLAWKNFISPAVCIPWWMNSVLFYDGCGPCGAASLRKCLHWLEVTCQSLRQNRNDFWRPQLIHQPSKATGSSLPNSRYFLCKCIKARAQLHSASNRALERFKADVIKAQPNQYSDFEMASAAQCRGHGDAKAPANVNGMRRQSPLWFI